MTHSRSSGSQKRLKSILVTIGLLAATKLKWIIGFLKLSKFGTTFISLGISLAGYAVFYGWKFAFALIYLIFIHEMGHLLAAKRKGIATSPAVFLPFVGAVISMKEAPKDAKTEAYLAYGGPLIGMIGFLPAIPLYAVTNNPFWGLVIMLGAMINLFNLFPVSPLDGGRIVSVLSTKIWFIGLLVMLPLLFFWFSPILILVFIFGFITWWKRAREGYIRKVLSYKIDKQKTHINELNNMTAYMFDPAVNDEGELIYRRNVSYYNLQEVYRKQERQMMSNIKQKRSFFIPFLQDKERFKYDQQKVEFEFLEKKKHLLTVFSMDSENLTRKIHSEEKELMNLKENMARLKTYYEAPKKTKWLVLVLYVGLAAVLSLFFWYGTNIMEQYPPGMF
ncbi:site-2 protease family protein [Bacillus taeanensis]|uniref:Site-2 protease family protein n=1 Tax=Bacillus taeanensis TaxID=273032 RepID=A0A366XTW0_9BACI|nr:site-2 protease family protein [Bacillus taeanensis]RBW68988.1 site-2 protease family protein [Bacillus taeanensis]